MGHMGITLGIAFAIMRILKKNWNPKMFILVVGVASITPDLIDKPLGLLYGFQGGGRLLSHTLILSAAVMVISLLLWRIASGRGLSISFLPLLFSLGVWIHLPLDFMWEDLEVLFWPAYGLGFPPGEFSWVHLTESPLVITGEVIGALVIAYLSILLFQGKFAVEEPVKKEETI
ncbi:MAG: metal-dependent hydrolase [Thermoplasmata archaeon]